MLPYSRGSRGRTIAALAIAVAALTSSLAPARLEAQAATGRASSLAATQSITGVVLDQSGAVLPNAQVELKNAGGVTVQSATADAGGNFVLAGVAPGRYELLFTFDGFEPTTSRVAVGTRAPAALRVTLPLARISQELTVGNGPAEVNAGAASNLDSSTVDQSTFENLPVFNQDLLATMSRFLDLSAVGASGATLIVNGIEVNALSVPASAIQQIKINQDPYSAEFSRPGRGRIEVITKPGSQSYEGVASAVLRSSVLDAKNAYATARTPEQRAILEGFLGGPVGHSPSTGFTLSMKHDQEDTQAIVVAQDLNGEVHQNISAPFRNNVIAGTVTHQQSKKNSMSLTVSYLNNSRQNQGVGGTTLATAGVDWDTFEQETTYTQQTIFTPKLLHQFRLLVGFEHEQWTSTLAAPSIVVTDAFTGGGAQGDRIRTEQHFTLTDTLTWSRGRQVVKVGFNIPDWSRRGWNDMTNTAGTFTFSSLASYAAARPYSFVQQVGDGNVAFVEKQVGAFVQDEIRVRANLTMVAGLRYDWQNYTHDLNNLAPRVSFAWAPAGSDKTVIRGGTGLFFERTGPNPILDVLRYDGQHLLRYVITDPGFPNPFPNGPAAGFAGEPSSVVRFAPGLVNPPAVQYSVSLERQLRRGTGASVTYTGTRGFDQFMSRDVNAPLPPLYLNRPDPAYSTIREIESAGRMVGNSLQLSLKGQMGHHFTGSVQYLLSKTMNDTSGINWMPPNSYDLSGEYARADFDQRHRFDLLGTFNPGALFNLGVALAVYSGKPYSVTTGRDAFNTGFAGARPDGVPRNSADGPDYADLDLRWSYPVHLYSAAKKNGPTATVGIDAFNVLNRVNDTRYVGTITSPFFGQAVSAQPPRRLQMSVRFKF